MVIDGRVARNAREEPSSEDGICCGQFDVYRPAKEPRNVRAESFFEGRHGDDKVDVGCRHRGSEQLVHEVEEGIAAERQEQFAKEIEHGIQIGLRSKATENCLALGASVEGIV